VLCSRASRFSSGTATARWRAVAAVLRTAPSISHDQNGHPIREFGMRHQVAVLRGTRGGVAERPDAVRDDRHLLCGVCPGDGGRHQGVTPLGVSDDLSLRRVEQAVPSFEPGHGPLDSRVEVGERWVSVSTYTLALLLPIAVKLRSDPSCPRIRRVVSPQLLGESAVHTFDEEMRKLRRLGGLGRGAHRGSHLC
jgi:hypothetical protein